MPETYEERANAFIKEYGELVNKYQVDFAHYPVYTPTAQGVFSTTLKAQVVDLHVQETKEPVESK